MTIDDNTAAASGGADQPTPWSSDSQLTLTPGNQAALGDITFTNDHETLHISYSDLQFDPATYTYHLPNKLIDFGEGDSVVVDDLIVGEDPFSGIKSSYASSSGTLTLSVLANGTYDPYVSLTFGDPARPLFSASPTAPGEPTTVTLAAPPPGDPRDGTVGDVTATRADPAAWSADATLWESPEFLANWGDAAVDAQYAYALGLTGAGVKVGVVDSGVYEAHQEFADNPNIVPVDATGTYSSTGSRYETQDSDPNANFTAGESFDIPGTFDPSFNDTHGTTVVGQLAAARNGTGMQGVAYGSTVYVGNSGGTDAIVDGPNQDYNYFKAVYGAVAAAGARAINTSWGSDFSGSDYTSVQGLIDTYALYQGKPSWLDAVADTVNQYGEIQTWAAGNDGSGVVPIMSAALPYVRPDLETHWIAVEAETQGSDPTSVALADFSNRAGGAKYWSIAAPGNGLDVPAVGGPLHYSQYVDSGDPNPYIGWGGGTSDAAPNVTGALALVMQRYAYLGNAEARDVVLTTAAHHDAVAGTPDHTAGDGSGLARDDAPNAIWGWGALDIKAAMDGPTQFLGAFTVDMSAAQSDTWNNTITEDALVQRKAEDATEQAAWQQTLATKGWDKTPPTAASSIDDQTAYAVGTARAAAAAARVYQGSLVKEGDGTLTLDGAGSTYSGGTALDGGALDIGALGAAGTGAITFGAGAETLILDAAAFGTGTAFANTIAGLAAGDAIDVRGVTAAGATAAVTGTTLTLQSGAVTRSLTLEAPTADTLSLSDDGQGGTLVSVTPPMPAASGGGGGGAPAPVVTAPVPAVTAPVPVVTAPAPVVTASPPAVTSTGSTLAADTLTVDPGIAYAGDGSFTITGHATSALDIASVAVSADVDGTPQTLGTADLAPDGSFTFTDPVGAATQSLLALTLTDGAGVQTSLAVPSNLTAGLDGPYAARRDDFDPVDNHFLGATFFREDGAVGRTTGTDATGAVVTDTRIAEDGSRATTVLAPGQTVTAQGFDTFLNRGQANTTFVFDPGFGDDVVRGFRLRGDDHATLSLAASDFGSIADVLRNTGQDGANIVIGDPVTGDTIRLDGVTKAQLAHNRDVLAFHA